jgi:hypothetical protein
VKGKRMKTELNQEEAVGVEAALRLRGVKVVTQTHEEIHWDATTQKYLPSTYTYTVRVQVSDDRTGNHELETVAGRADIEAAIGRAEDRLAASAKRTRRAIRAERQSEQS